MTAIGNWCARLGPLRVVLLLCVALILVLTPAPGTQAIYGGWGLVRTVLVPVLAPLLFMVLLLDALMARVFMSDAEGDARRRLRAIVLLDLVVAGVLVLVWIPYYMALRP
jgi:hypothetical protein